MPFSKDEVTAIKLLSVLKLKKAPINAYKSLMEWHLKRKGELQYYQGIQDSKTYISREKILKKLSDRYNYGWMYPYKKKIKLPVSGTKHCTTQVLFFRACSLILGLRMLIISSTMKIH